MKGFRYVYILVSELDDRRHYSGITRDLKARIIEHNQGKCPHTSKHRKATGIIEPKFPKILLIREGINYALGYVQRRVAEADYD